MNWGGAGQGAMGGAAAGSMFGPWGTAIGAVGGGLIGMFGQQDEETDATYNTQWNQNPQYGYTQPNMDYLSNYYNQGLNQLQAGKAPLWYQQYEQAQKPRQKMNASQMYFGGSPYGGAGLMDQNLSQMVKMGTPAGKRPTQQGKLLDSYANQSRMIDEYFTTGGSNAMRDTEAMYLGGMRNLPEGPSGSWSQWQTPGSYQQGMGGQIASAGIAMSPWLGNRGTTGNTGNTGSWGSGSGYNANGGGYQAYMNQQPKMPYYDQMNVTPDYYQLRGSQGSSLRG